MIEPFVTAICERLEAADAGEWPDALYLASQVGYDRLKAADVEPEGEYVLYHRDRRNVPAIKVRFSEDCGGICILEAAPIPTNESENTDG